MVSKDDFWRRQWQSTPVLLPGKSHGWRSLVGCSPWGREESYTTARLHFHFSLSCIGEENGNPLQCSCLENPRDGGAWWAAIYGVAQSRTQLKQLSSKDDFVCVCSVASDSLQPYRLYQVRLLCPWDFPGKNTGVGCPFPTPGESSPGIEPMSLALACGFFTTSTAWETQVLLYKNFIIFLNINLFILIGG